MDVFFEIIGYLGSGIVIISMLMTSLTKLRIINVAGAVFSTVYALWTEAWPVVLLNCVLMSINVYKIIRELSAVFDYESLSIRLDNKIVECYISRYAKDIRRISPALLSAPSDTSGALVMRGGDIAGLILDVIDKDGEVIVYMDPNNRNKTSRRFCAEYAEAKKLV